MEQMNLERTFKYKVLFLLSNPAIGGTETFTLALVPMLREQDIDARIVNMWADSKMEKIAKEDCIPFSSFSSRSRYLSLKNCAEILKYLRRERFDFIYVFGLRMNLFSRLIYPFIKGTRLISGVRNVDTWRNIWHIWADRLTQKILSYTVCNSKVLLENKCRREKISRHKLGVIYNGINTLHFSPDAEDWPDRKSLGLPEGRIFVTVANLRYTKGHDFYIDSIEQAITLGLPEDVSFLWIGTGPLMNELKETIQKMNLSERIIFAGSQFDVRPFLVNSDAFVLASKEEGMPRAMLEAMAMGLPVLCTDVGGNAEIVRDQIEGIVVQYKDVEAMARALVELSSDRWMNASNRTISRDRILSFFKLEMMVDHHVKLFDRLYEN